MSIDALVLTRTRPELGLRAHDVVDLEFVQITAPRAVEPRDWRSIGRAPDPSLGWVIDVSCSNSAYKELAAFAKTLARRCGGGLFWCDLTARTLAVAAGPDDRRPLRRALEVAQLEAEDDEDDWDEPARDAPARGPRLFHTEQWDVGVAQVGDVGTWVRPGLTTMLFVLFEGAGAAVEEVRRVLEQTFDPGLGAVKLEVSSEPPAGWVERVRRAGGGSVSCVRAGANELACALAGDVRGYRIFARKAEPLKAEAKLLLGSAVVLCSSEVWRALGDDIDRVLVEVVEAQRRLGAEAAARAIRERAAGVATAAVVVAYYRAPTGR